MDVLTLLSEARRRGLLVEHDGGSLRVRGPQRHAALAERLGRRKDEVLAALRSSEEFLTEVKCLFDGQEVPARDDDSIPASELWPSSSRTCRCCGGTRRWRLRRGGPWICPRCHPPLPPPDQLEWSEESGRG